jgi:hypothetical protein
LALYELGTYTLHVGKMAEAVKLYQEIGFPALQKGRAGQEACRLFPKRYRHDQSASTSLEVRRRS